MTYKGFYNLSTGKSCYIPAGRAGTFFLSIRKAVQYVKYSFPKYYCCHLTLTQAKVDNNLSYEHLNRVMTMIRTFVKRQDTYETPSDIKYIAVKEYNSSGVRENGQNLHYHVLIFYSKPYAMPDVERIAKSWALGFVKISAPKVRLKLNRIVSYLGKYLGKGYEYDSLNSDVKSFTASQIPSVFKLSEQRLSEAHKKFGVNNLSRYKATFTKIFRFDCRGEKHLVMSWRSDWIVISGFQPEPF